MDIEWVPSNALDPVNDCKTATHEASNQDSTYIPPEASPDTWIEDKSTTQFFDEAITPMVTEYEEIHQKLINGKNANTHFLLQWINYYLFRNSE